METVDTFREPRAWALQWEGSALLFEPQEPQAWPRPQFAWNPRWQRVDLVEGSMSASRNGHHAGAWREPSSWSLAWDVTVAVDGTATVGKATGLGEAAGVSEAASVSEAMGVSRATGVSEVASVSEATVP